MVRLERATTIRCVFDMGIQAAWKKGALTLSPTPVHMGEGGITTFDSITLKPHVAGPCELPLSAVMLGKARVIGNGGADDVFVMAGMGSLSFIETTGLGSVIVTTLFADYQNVDTLEYFAVTSRHIGGFAGMSQPFPSQYHGTCRVMP